MKNPDILAAIKPVAEAFEKLGILYYIGGSVASSAYGFARSTMDVDIVSDLKPGHVKQLVGMLESSFYIDEEVIQDAIRHNSSFNIIHLETMFKIDVFISKNEPYDIEAFRRRKKDTFDEDQTGTEFYLVSPEDVIINKLLWFRSGGHVADTHLKDILGVLKVQQNNLDFKYLQQWASRLKIHDLLEKSLQEAGINKQ